MDAKKTIPGGRISGRGLRAAMAAAAAFCLFCEDGGPAIRLIYVPPVTFTGYVNGTYTEMRGQDFQPNTCELFGDTVKMFMCTDDYSPDATPTGAYMRLELYTIERDSGDTTPITMIGTKDMLLKYGDHTQGVTQSYQVVPADSDFTDVYVRAEIGSIERSHGGSIRLTDLGAVGRPVFGTVAPSGLTITDGVVEGTVD